MSRIFRVAHVGICGLLGLILGQGCGPSQAERESRVVIPSSMEESALAEVGVLYRLTIQETKRPPRSLKDFENNGLGYAYGYDWLKRGDLVTTWGVELSDSASGTILAQEKKAPESGGFVLMQDGKTVKKLTADEFKNAPKAGTAANSR